MVPPEYEKEHVKKHLSAMTGEVELIVFTQEKECQFCRETRELMLELGTLSPKIKTTVYDLVKDEEMAKKYLPQLSWDVRTTGSDITACLQVMSSPSFSAASRTFQKVHHHCKRTSRKSFPR